MSLSRPYILWKDLLGVDAFCAATSSQSSNHNDAISSVQGEKGRIEGILTTPEASRTETLANGMKFTRRHREGKY